jgi:hypothetical protein
MYMLFGFDPAISKRFPEAKYSGKSKANKVCLNVWQHFVAQLGTNST